MKGSLLLYNLKLNCLIFFYIFEQFTDYIYTDIYCKLSKCIGQTPCSYEHCLVSTTTIQRLQHHHFQNSQNQNTFLLFFCRYRLSVSCFLAPDNWRLFLAPETSAGNKHQKMVINLRCINFTDRRTDRQTASLS